MCNLKDHSYTPGSCLTDAGNHLISACKSTLREKNGVPYRLIKSAHLSRPEHYFSLYQSGCNLSCLHCHSHQFSQVATGDWFSPYHVLDLAISYELLVTYIEKKDCVTAYHGAELCNCCGKCVTDIRPESCPNQVDSTQIILSPQGWGPARNIIGFTGGDLLCCPEFYVKCTKLIKKETNLYVLLETNGFGLTPAHLTMLKRAGVDSFWLDMKAFDDKTHIKLTGASNQHILQLPHLIKEMGFCLEVLSLYIPDWVETEQIQKIAALLVDVDPAIPFTILAYFPAHKMTVRSPRLDEMISAYDAAKEAGLHNVKMGNLGVLSKE